MQPKRDPNDRRYWPVREGGAGQGFSRLPDRRQHPHSFRAIQGVSVLNDSMDENVINRPRGGTPEAIRTRSRLILELALDKLEGKLDDASVKDLNGAISALGRVGGVQSTDINIQGGVAHLHLDALRAPRAKVLPVHEIEDAKLLESGDTTSI
jgi:hypothetical protein